MRILLAANASYVPPRGGATRSNLVWLEALSARGHACRAVAAALPSGMPGKLEQLREEGIEPPEVREDGVETARRGAVLVSSAADPARRSALLRQEIEQFQPDWVLVSSEDIGQLLLRAAEETAPGRVVFLAHTPQFFPFGPASWSRDAAGAELVARAAAIVAIGHRMADYIEQYLGRRATVVHPPIYGPGPFPNYGCHARGLVTMINPCAVKGISIYLRLAERFPACEFGALPGWGTTSADRRALDALPNVTVLPNCGDIAEVLERTRILLMPSLWYEGFGLIATEAMLHGIPVIASDSGGLPEAKCGTGFVVPVRPIERYEPVFDERGLPRAVVPEQDLDLWARALGTLLSDGDAYARESAASRAAALRFVSGVRETQLEELLLSLEQSIEPAVRGHAPPGDARAAMANLSAEKRALLLQRLRAKRPGV